MVSTARDRARVALTEEITAAARDQLAVVGAAGLSLRAVARELGMASSAVYRYFPSRDHLLTRLIVEGYDAVGAAAEAQDDPGAPPRRRWLDICRTVRGWALAHPHEYALLYGSPVPGYRAPAETIPAAARVGVLLGAVLADAARRGVLPPASGEATGNIEPAVVAALGGDAPGLDDAVRARVLLAWSSIYGAISFELFGHFVGSVIDADRFFDDATGALADMVGLAGATDMPGA